MYSIIYFLPAIGIATVAAQQFEFTNPPELASQSSYDFSTNPIYHEGDVLNIQWTPGQVNATRLTMFQTYDGLDNFNPTLEYIDGNVAALATSYAWTVSTGQNLSASHVFYIQLYIPGQTAPLGDTSFFNITAATTTVSSSTTTTLSTSVLSTSTGASTTVEPVPASTTSAASTSSAAATGSSSGLSTGTEAGIGVGVAAAVILGLIAGWFLFGRKRKQRGAISSNAEDGADPHRYYESSYTPVPMQDTKLSEMNAYSNMETSDPPAAKMQPMQNEPYQLDAEGTSVPTAHELPVKRM